MSANWKVGDRAVCVDDRWSGRMLHVNPPKNGHVYIVVEVHESEHVITGKPAIGLVLAGCHVFDKNKFLGIFTKRGPQGSWHSDQFRKLVPTCDREKQIERYSKEWIAEIVAAIKSL